MPVKADTQNTKSKPTEATPAGAKATEIKSADVMPGANPRPIEAGPVADSRLKPFYGFIEFFSSASHVGTSFLAGFAVTLLRQRGIRVVFVRIESKTARAPGAADIHIDTEDLAGAAKLPGGEVAILRPAYQALERAARNGPSAVVMDWGGGLAEHRARIFAATGFDQRLAELGLRGLSVVVTTSLADRMRQAADLLNQNRVIVPGLVSALALNRRAGSFHFVTGSEESRVFAALNVAAQGGSIIRIPGITGETWQTCEAASLSMTEVIESDLAELARRLGDDSGAWFASAFQMQVAAWWRAAERTMLPVLSGRDAAQD